ncbi:predicted protein [Postia placenta Mad-698-R]|nr:predicted protein [Postia placenta Mad-698-R]
MTVARNTVTKKAVSIGVEYRASCHRAMALGHLPGAHKDPQMLSSILQSRFGYKEENIKILSDDKNHNHDYPSAHNIYVVHIPSNYIIQRDAMNWLVDNAGPEDHLVFHFIFPVDYALDHEGAMTNYITDDEIHQLVEKVPKDTHFIMIFDCCHSGHIAELHHELHSDVHLHSLILPQKSSGQGGETSFIARNATLEPKVVKLEPHHFPNVECWEACRADQLALGDKNGGLFMRAFTQAIRSRALQDMKLARIISPEWFNLGTCGTSPARWL